MKSIWAVITTTQIRVEVYQEYESFWKTKEEAVDEGKRLSAGSLVTDSWVEVVELKLGEIYDKQGESILIKQPYSPIKEEL